MTPDAAMTDRPTPADPPLVSVVVPAWNEAENLPLLVPRVDAALAGVAYEVVVVDDGSRDGTPAACAELATRYPVRLVVRDAPEHGLSGAVLRGIAESRGATVVVMDADLQHPPERLPALLAALDGGADFALGSRYVAGGSTDGHWTLFRKVNSWVATALARPFAGRVRDPMSGFFALRRETLDRARRLTPLGYKIALELMCKCRVRQVVEVPIHFGLRTRGQSKLTLAQQFRYLEHLSRLYDFTFPRASPIGKFLVTVAAGFAVGSGLYAAARAGGAGATAGVVAGYAGVVAVTALFHARYVRTQRAFLVTRRPWGDFVVIAAAECAAAALAAAWLARHARAVPAWEFFALCFAAAIAARYVLRKELLQDIRGLRRDLRADELAAEARP